jgi:hypothetical protein
MKPSLGHTNQRAPDDDDHRVSLHGAGNQEAGRLMRPAWRSN